MHVNLLYECYIWKWPPSSTTYFIENTNILGSQFYMGNMLNHTIAYPSQSIFLQIKISHSFILSKVISAFIRKNSHKTFLKIASCPGPHNQQPLPQNKKNLTRKEQVYDSRKAVDQTGAVSEHCPQVRVQHNWLIVFLSCRYCLSKGVPWCACGFVTGSCHRPIPEQEGFFVSTAAQQHTGWHLAEASPVPSPSLPPQHQTLRIWTLCQEGKSTF